MKISAVFYLSWLWTRNIQVLRFVVSYIRGLMVHHEKQLSFLWWRIYVLQIPLYLSQPLGETNSLTCWIVLKITKDVPIFTFCYHILDFVQQKKTKFTVTQPYILPILYCQYHACWCPGHLRSQDISRHGIDQIRWNIPSLASQELKKIPPVQDELTDWDWNKMVSKDFRKHYLKRQILIEFDGTFVFYQRSNW